MNDVSWRRILEQADSKHPFGDDQDLPNSSEHASSHGESRQDVDWSNLEAELSRATQPSAKPQPARPRRPSPGQHATQLKMRMEQASAKEVSPVPEPQAKPARSSGARNLIAISLSLAVVAFAVHQLSESLPETGAGADEAATPQSAGTASFVSAASGEDEAEAAKPRIRANGNRLDFRPSLASEAEWPPEDVAVTNSTTTTSLNPDEVATILPDGPQNTFQDGENETLVLNRGREILERGHISGARLIFEYLADRGSALGAFALAQTYDAKFISKNNLPADAADEALATKWYRQAAEITNAAAETQ